MPQHLGPGLGSMYGQVSLLPWSGILGYVTALDSPGLLLGKQSLGMAATSLDQYSLRLFHPVRYGKNDD
jgi:hypothetical protein